MPRPALTVGDRLTSDTLQITEQAIIDFARAFDPQPYHLDRSAGDASIFGGLCASGWQVAALSTRLIQQSLIDAELPVTDISGVESMRWFRPTFVDDTIKTISEVASIGEDNIALKVQVMTDDDVAVATMHCQVALLTGVSP